MKEIKKTIYFDKDETIGAYILNTKEVQLANTFGGKIFVQQTGKVIVVKYENSMVVLKNGEVAESSGYYKIVDGENTRYSNISMSTKPSEERNRFRKETPSSTSNRFSKVASDASPSANRFSKSASNFSPSENRFSKERTREQANANSTVSAKSFSIRSNGNGNDKITLLTDTATIIVSATEDGETRNLKLASLVGSASCNLINGDLVVTTRKYRIKIDFQSGKVVVEKGLLHKVSETFDLNDYIGQQKTLG